MNDTIVFLAIVMSFIVGYLFGGDHVTAVATRAKWEREAKEWDERHERLMRELGIEVDE